ncbi:MAG: M24 family metallopeptidase [Gammaproteobacteria bacterium]|nr:M24 family metallopeptidase [Gammaproteobacteria bacterium]MDH3434282.1 M24 family metallopeptidase [Gammaproteobacteria bacterium]
MSIKPKQITASPSTKLGRRELLKAGAALSVGSLLAMDAEIANAEPGRSIELPGADELVPSKMPKGFSATEMQRRWKKCREWMNRDKFDCLIVPARPQGNADVKWLSESNANWMVFPAEGQPTLIFRGGDDSRNAKDKSPVEFDLRVSRFNRSQVIIDRLKELGLERARIGVGNLSGQMRNDEGGVSYVTMLKLKNALPKATFETAVPLLMQVKLERGADEIEVLRLASRVSELAIRAIVETAGPGVPHRDVWFHVFKTLLNASGEEPQRISIRGGDEGNTAGGRPLDEIFVAGQICSQELSGMVLGYASQVNHAMCIGPTKPRNWDSAFKYCVEIFHALVDYAKPGVSFQEYSEFYRKKVEAKGTAYWGVVFHTAGASGDGPRMGPTRPDENGDLVIQPGMVFTIKPRFAIAGVETPSAQFGDAVLITENGAERLGRRKPEVITLGT